MSVDNRTTSRIFDVTLRLGDEWVRVWAHRAGGWFSVHTSAKVRIPIDLARDLGSILLDLQAWDDSAVDLREQAEDPQQVT